MKKSSHNIQKVLVTGGSSGLGQAFAHSCRQKQLEVLTTGKTSGDLALDLTDPISRKKLIQEIEQFSPDLLVNAAGLGYYGPAAKHPIQESLDILTINCTALTELTIAFIQSLHAQNRPGTVLNISSAGGFVPFPTFATYCASKSYVTHFSRALDTENSPHGIRILCACPGQVATSFRLRAARGKPQQHDRRTMSQEKAVDYLWKQITKGKPLSIFGWRTRFMLFTTHFIPRPLLNHILTNSLKSRY